MSVKVVLVDYHVGNLLSVSRALEHCGAEVEVTGDTKKIANAERLVLPGVGSFGGCAGKLEQLGLAGPVKEFCASGRPFLGICVGMQVMLEVGEEFGDHDGLGLIKGRTPAIPNTGADGTPHKIPHIGWNRLLTPPGLDSWKGTILEDTEPGASVYFVHSYTAQPVDEANRLADCDYDGRTISAAVRSGNMYGCQFHPEKSGKAGLKVLTKFLSL